MNHMDCPASILVVDDQPSARATLEALLAPEGYDLDFACDGSSALSQARERQLDLILLDVMMPDMDGFEVCRRLRADPALALVPIMMVTALGDEASLVHGISAGADDFIAKPFNSAELRARVRTTTRLNRYRRLIDEQQRAAAERARFAWVVAQSDHGYLVVDSEDRIHYANQQARRYLELAPDSTDLPELPLSQLLSQLYISTAQPGQPSGAAQPCAGQPSYLVRPESHTAPELWLKVDRLAAPAPHTPDTVIQLRNVTSELISARDMWTFHSAIAHKLRTPFVGLLGGLGMLANDIERLPPTTTQDMATLALQSAKRLHRTIEEILNFAGVPSPLGGAPLCDATDIPALVRQIGAELELPRIVLTERTPLAPATLALGQPVVEIMLRELIENAQKYHPQHAPAVEIVAAQEPDGSLRIAVLDDGLTLTPEQLARVATPYYQGEKNFTGQLPGMGLGLATISRIVWGIGGSFRIANRAPEPGVQVDLYIPRKITP
jgi:DNA-binding response OmpR family regulator